MASIVGNPTGATSAERGGSVRAQAVAKAAGHVGRGGFGPEPGHLGAGTAAEITRQGEIQASKQREQTKDNVEARRERVQDLRENIQRRRENIQDIRKREPTERIRPVT